MSTPTTTTTPQSLQQQQLPQQSAQQGQFLRSGLHVLQTTGTQSHPLLSRLETLIQTIGDADQRDDLKLKALQEISNNFEEMTSAPAFQIVQENLLRIFLKILQDTVPQFIGENNTQQLRKLMLELILRMSCNDVVKQYAKPILTQLTKVIQVENEENAVIAIKIIGEHQRAFRTVFSPEIPAIISHFKAIYRDMPQHITGGRMFEQRNLRHCGMEDSVIESSLQNCYMLTIVYLPENLGDGSQRDSGYSLIPRASQSVKVLSEVPMFCIILFQIHRHHLQNELVEMISLMVQYCILSIPVDQRTSASFSTLLADEFYNSQVRALTFLGFVSSRAAVFSASEVINNHGTQIVQAIMQLLERCPHENFSMRRELIGTVKNIFITDLQTSFIPVIPKLFNENLMLGNGFSSVDFLRPSMYTMLADLVHHVRVHLSYNLLCCSIYAFTKSMFDSAIPPTVQSMCIKLMMNLIESFVITEKNHPDQPCRDILFCLLENYVRKLKWLARYQIPIILEKNESSILNAPLVYFDRSISNAHSARTDSAIGRESIAVTEMTPNKAVKEDLTSPDSSENDFDLSVLDEDNEKEQSGSSIPSLPIPTKTGKTSTPEAIFIRYWVTGIPPYSLIECRNMIRVLVQACKHVVHALKDTHATNFAISPDHEAKIMDHLFRYGLRCLDIYVICPVPNQVPSNTQRFSNGVRTKEEKEVLELFGSIFTLLNPSVFKDIISKRIDYFIERLASNYGLQIICSSLLVNSVTSANFGDILIRFLMTKLPDLAESSEKSFLWLKLFKIVFSSVGSQPSGCAENERMLRPYLHNMVLQSMDLALRAREPINYFLLLRALFRSIGGGSYDLLYQTFLPLLPTLLHQLNRLQSSTHRTQMRELFIELCLTVPVRLSSLLPYLPLLMDPLVCALNGSSSLVQQGLRTLELCVDNLQPDYLFEHMVPVRAQLMRGLWQCMSSQEKTAPQIAFRILGKFGAANRKMLIDPQNLAYREEHLFESPAFRLVLERSLPAINESNESQSVDCSPALFCELSISEIVKESVRHLRSPFLIDVSFIMATSQTVPAGIRISSLAVRRHAFRIVRGVILGALAPPDSNVVMNPFFKKHITNKLLELRKKEFDGFEPVYQCSSRCSRSLFLDALLGLFYAAAAVFHEAISSVMDFFCMVIRQITVQIILEQCREKDDILDPESNCMDGTVLIDALVLALSDPCKEVCQTSLHALKLICETAFTLLGRPDKVAVVPFFQYIVDRTVNLCYSEPWCMRLGGCVGIKYILMNFPLNFVHNSIDAIICALFEVIVGLMDDVSSSAVDAAISSLDLLLKVCFEKVSDYAGKKEATECVVRRIVENLLSPSRVLSEQCQKMLTSLAKYTDIPRHKLLLVQDELLGKFLRDGMTDFKTMSLDQQIAFEAAFVFVFSLRPVPKNFFFNKCWENEFASQLISICNASEKELMDNANYKPPTPLLAVVHRSQLFSRIISLGQWSIKALTACCIASCEESGQPEEETLLSHRKEILQTLMKCLTKENEEIQHAAYCALKEALNLEQLKMLLHEMNLNSMIPSLCQPDSRLQKNVAQRVFYLLCLFPAAFQQTFNNQLLDAFHRFPDPKQDNAVADDLKVGELLLCILAEYPHSEADFVQLIIPYVRKWEDFISFGIGVNWRYPLIKYLRRFPLETVRFFVTTSSISEEGSRELFKDVVKHEEATTIREALMADKSFLLHLLQGEAMNETNSWTKCDISIYDMELLSMKLIVSIGKRHPSWAANGAADIVKIIQTLWNDRDFRIRYTCKDYLEGPRYDVPKLAALIMLRYFKANIDRIDIIFDLCHVFTNCYIGDFTFIRIFLEKEVIPKYPIKWRQNALKRIVAMFEKDPATAHDLNVVKMLQYVVIPSLHYAFERYDVDVVVGTPAKPDDVDDNNLISLVCQKVLDRTKFQLSDAMLIQLFHLGCLFVSNCPTHIHDFSQKKQGNRLRILMLLGWPCLSTNPQDQTMKYMGHLLIANIINQFNINRKIVLQVFLSLLKATLNDPKDIIKRSLDILTPSVPLRMDDGHKQLMTVVKKTIVEEGHNIAQVYHCLSMIVRHYKIYYNVRHQMLQVIMNGVQRLMLAQGSLENRRTAIDVCEMVIKWEQWRIKQAEDLEKEAEASSQKQSHFETNTTESPLIQQQPTSSCSMEVQNKDIHRPIEKVHVDHVVNLLIKLSSAAPDASFAQNPTQHAVAMEQLCKRCLGLLRAALKSNLWGHIATLKLSWLEKQLTLAAEAVTQQFREHAAISQHFSQLHTSLDIITHLVVILPPEAVVTNIKMLQRGIVACLNCQDNAVMRSLCQLVAKLFEKTKSSPEGLDELEMINQFVTKFINDTFANYEKGQSQPMTGVFATIHLLRTICAIQPAYIDTMCLSSFTKAIQKLVREHCASCTENKGHAVTELIIFSLELLRPRIHTIPPEARRNIGQCILTPLIDKTPFDRVLDVVIRVVDVMVRSGDEGQLNQGIPLLIRLAQTIEVQKRHEKSGDLLMTLLGTVLYVYETPHLRTNETLMKLNSAFHWGLCIQDEALRSRFFKLLDAQIPKSICHRLHHIMALQNWTDMQHHFWIKHCISLLLLSIKDENMGNNSNVASQKQLLNCCTFWQTFAVVLNLDAELANHPESKCDYDSMLQGQDEDGSKYNDFSETSGSQTMPEVSIPICDTTNAQNDVQTFFIVEQQIKLFEMAARFKITDILPSYLELVHNNSELASKIWIKLLPLIWSELHDVERTTLNAEIMPFLASGCHLPQMDLPHSATATFLEALYHCKPPISWSPHIIKYISMKHRTWHRGIMMLEEEALEILPFIGSTSLMQILPPVSTVTHLFTLICLVMLYSKLSEFDQYRAIWKRLAYFEVTSKALDYYNEGDFVRAEETLRKLVEDISDRAAAPSGTVKHMDVTPSIAFELSEWHKLWVNVDKENDSQVTFTSLIIVKKKTDGSCCQRELGEWNSLLLYGNTAAVQDIGIVVDAAWHLNNWSLVRECLTQLEGCTPPDLYYKYYLYKAMLLNHQPLPEDTATELLHARISRELETARDDLITDWKRLPDIVSHSHIKILQAANFIQEVQEASVLTNHPEVSGQISLPSNPVGDVKSVVKAWRNRSCGLSDPLSFWVDIHQWRIQHYNTAIKLLQQMESSQPSQLQQSLLPVYSAAHSQIQIAHAARKSGLINVAINALTRMHTVPALPAMDAYFAVREHLKCLIKRASMNDLTEDEKRNTLVEAFNVIQNTSFNTFTKENIAKLYTLRGAILLELEKCEDAARTFSVASQLHENVACGNSVWLHWGSYLESRLDDEKTEKAALSIGLEAFTGLLEGARIENELRARKYIARLLWLMKKLTVYGVKVEEEMDTNLEKYGLGVPAINWLSWLPQLIAELKTRPSAAVAHIISYIGESYEQQVLYAIASLQPLDFILESVSSGSNLLENPHKKSFSSDDLFNIVIKKLHHRRPAEISALCRVIAELSSIKESWLECALRMVNHFKECLFKFAFENRNSLTSLSVPVSIRTEIKNWCSSLKDCNNCAEVTEDIKESLEVMRLEFNIEKNSKNDSLIYLISVMVKWSFILAAKFDKLPNKKLIRDISSVLASYSCKVANIEIFREHYATKIKDFSSIIYRFMPHYFVVRRGDVIIRRISIRALSGKVYCYYLDKQFGANRGTCGIHQLFALINHFLLKEKETCRRFLQLPVPHFAYIGNISLLECPNRVNSLYTFEGILSAILKNRINVPFSSELVKRFYDFLSVSNNITNQVLLNAFSHITSENILPVNSFAKWIVLRFDDATMHYTIRKQIALHTAILSICEYILHLEPATLDGLCLNLNTGRMMNVDYNFDLIPETLELKVEHVVPFRMSTNLHNFLGFAVEGDFNCSMVATTRCLYARKVVTYAQLFLWDIIAKQKEQSLTEILKLAQNAGKLLEMRLDDLCKHESLAKCVAELTQTARANENLARVDPRFHPWF